MIRAMIHFTKHLMVFTIVSTQICCNNASPKSDKNDINIQNLNQISHITYGTDIEAEKWFEYYENGDIFRYNSFIDTIVFTYQNDQIIKQYTNNGAEWLTKIIYDIDANGRAKSSTIFVEKNEVLSTYIFEYNEDGYLSKTFQEVKSSGYKYIQEFKYNKGNLIEVQSYTYYNKPSSRYLYEYYEDKMNTLNIFRESVLDDFFTNDRLGKLNKNLLRRQLNLSMEGDTLSWLEYNYIEDPSNAFLKQIENDVLNENTTERIFHFTNTKKKD